MTKAQLLRFVELRNKSPFGSNLQFSNDLDECGIHIDELGEGDWSQPGVFEWKTPHGTLIEARGRLRLVEDKTDVTELAAYGL